MKDCLRKKKRDEESLRKRKLFYKERVRMREWEREREKGIMNKGKREKMRIRDREINELNHLSVRARRCQSEITHQQMWTKIV